MNLTTRYLCLVSTRIGRISNEEREEVQYLDIRLMIVIEKSMIKNYTVTTSLKTQHILRNFSGGVFG
jgi:hypothetical protein